MIFDHAQARPDALAVDDLRRRRSWSELASRVSRLARWLRELRGLGVEDGVALLMHNRIEMLEAVLGGILAGIWVTPINRHLTRDEVAYVIADSGARMLFCDAEHEELAREAGAPELVTLGGELDALLEPLSDAPQPLSGPAGGCMIYTSGTSGRPKGVRRARPGNLGEALARQGARGAAYGLDGSGPHLVTGPLYHAAPLLFALYDQANGAPVVIQPRFDAAQCLELIQERQIRHSHLVPTMFVRLLQLPEAERQRFSPDSLSLVLHGAAPIAPSVKRRMIDWWGEILVEYWGGTEGGVCTLASSREWLAHPGTVGRAIAGYEVFAVDESGARLPPGEAGTLYSRLVGGGEAFEYHGDPAKTARAHLAPGTFTLGDVGRVDAEGFVYLVDRRSNTIISGGVNIYPAEIEHVLQEHPAVGDVAVFGIPDDEWGETVKAAIELAPGQRGGEALAAEILAFARTRLAAYKVPRSIDFEAELPRHPTGKLLTRQLRERYWRGRERHI